MAARIREAIFLGYLPDGKPLPPESDLAEQLGVANKTLREALAVLRGEGLIETRRGRSGGSFVQTPGGATKRFARDRLASMSVSELRDAADEHRAVAGISALLAASRADDDQVARIGSQLRRLPDASSVELRGRLDSTFHIEIAVAAQSERLTRSEATLQRESRDLLWILGGRRVDEVVSEHEAIFAAIEAQDGELARRHAEDHVMRNYRELLELRLRNRERDQ